MNNQANTENAELTVQEILKSVNYMIDCAIKGTTQIYSGLVVSNNNDGRWNIKYNDKIVPIKPYGSIIPNIGQNVKVIIPQGNSSVSFFI